MKAFVRTARADASWAAFLAFAFCAGFSMPAARVAMAVCLVFTMLDAARRRMIRFTAPTAGWLVYLALAFAVSAAAAALDWDPLLRPGRGVAKLTKLLWFAAIPLAVVQVDSRARLLSALRALVLGAAVTAFCVVAFHPAMAWLQVSFPTSWQMLAWKADPASSSLTGLQTGLYRAVESLGLLDAVVRWIELPWHPRTYGEAVVKIGSMADAQRLMVALPAAICLAAESLRERPRARRFAPFALLLLVAVGLLLVFKRGPVLAGVGVSFLLLLSRLRWWKGALVLAALAAAAAAMPHVRERFAELPSELSLERGGRALMWTRIVPELHREHPWGIGFRALTSEKMVQCEIRARIGDDRAAVEAAIEAARSAPPAERRPNDVIAYSHRLWRIQRWEWFDALATELARLRPAPDSPEAAELAEAREYLARLERVGVTDRHLELDRNHVHSTPLQAFVDFGWAGLLAWALWMGLALRATGALALRSRRPAPGSALPETLCFAAPLAMLGALVLFGLVEYNLADAAVVPLYALAMGLSGPSLRRSE